MTQRSRHRRRVHRPLREDDKSIHEPRVIDPEVWNPVDILGINVPHVGQMQVVGLNVDPIVP